MKTYLFSLLTVSASLLAIDLNQASNQQLLDEVARRMNGGTNVVPAIASYICDTNYVRVKLTGESQTGEVALYLEGSNRCLEQTNVLNAYKSKITSFSIIALCDSNYLRRYKMLVAGTISPLDSTYIGDYDQCLTQAKAINQN